jgi:hypothetical protein
VSPTSVARQEEDLKRGKRVDGSPFQSAKCGIDLLMPDCWGLPTKLNGLMSVENEGNGRKGEEDMNTSRRE